MVWGPLIAIYLFLAGASAGAFLTSAFVEAKYPENRKMRIGGRVIAPILLAIGLVMLMLDAEAGLKNPLRFFFLVVNPGSVMTLGVYAICVFLPVSLVIAFLELRKRAIPKALKWVGVVFAFCIAAYTGFLLGVIPSYPLWNNAVLPILFVVSALSAGLALVSLIGLFTDRAAFEQMWLLKKAHVILSALELVILATMLVIVSSGSPEGAASVAMLTTGSFAPVFWGLLVVAGIVLPFAIEAYPVLVTKRIETSATSFALNVLGDLGVVAGGFALRLLIILAAIPVAFV